MPLLVWNDKLSLGLPSIDQQHQRLVEMLNELFDAVQAGRGRDVLGRVLVEVLDYTITHFAYEEQLLVLHGYPDTELHRQEHADLSRQVFTIQQKYCSGASMTLSMEAMNFLRNWLIKHIQGSDRKYAAFLSGKGVR